MELQSPTIRAPEFPTSLWFNTLRPLTMSSMHGSIVLVQFWDFTNIHCLRTLPYLRIWHQRYSTQGLTMIGVHTPGFSFARDGNQVKSAVGRLGISWPIIQDNDQVISQSYNNSFLPSIYLIDMDGCIRYQYQGEGGYVQTERAIHLLLHTIHPQIDFPDPVSPLRHEDATGAVCYPISPELQLDAVGNPQKPVTTPACFEFPEQITDNQFYLHGWWKREKDGYTLVSENGSIFLRYSAASAYGVFAPSPDPVDQALGLQDPILVKLFQEGAPLPEDGYTEDLYTAENEACLRVDCARSYALVQNIDVRSRELLLKIQGTGFTLYSFSFESCIDRGANPIHHP